LTASPSSPSHRPQNKPGCEKSVVQPLVGAQYLGSRCQFLPQAEGAQPGGFVPQKHFQNQDIDVQQSDDGDDGVGGKSHGVAPE
jgi:hypothetical protein